MLELGVDKVFKHAPIPIVLDHDVMFILSDTRKRGFPTLLLLRVCFSV